MFARLLISFCLCCVILSALVAFLSRRAIDKATDIQNLSKWTETSCSSLIDEPPQKSTWLLLSDFVFINRIATIDKDGDGKWDEVAVPLFSPNAFESKASYSAVIACFRNVPDLETLQQRLATHKLQANYRIGHQKLGSTLHSQLALKLNNMDFRKSPVVTVGYGGRNPVLGRKTLHYSYLIGAAAIGIVVLTLVNLACARKLKTDPCQSRTGLKRKPAVSTDSQATMTTTQQAVCSTELDQCETNG